MTKMLVVYYSWSNGNTKRIAEMIAEEKKADIAEIKTAEPYKGSYDQVVAQGQKEVDAGFCPAIQPLEKNPSDYDVIAIGTPTWWYTMAPAVRTFLKEYDFSNKLVIPFVTNGGWPGHVIKDICVLIKNAKMGKAIEIQFDSNGGDQLVTDIASIKDWIKNI